jgi:aspartyl protease family protein
MSTPQSIGRGMAFLAWALGLALLAWLFQDILDEQHNPNRQLRQSGDTGGVAEIVLERNRQGHYIATGQINGVDVEFLLDTGATAVAIPAGLAERLKLKRGHPQQTTTAAGRITTYRTVLEQVALGPIVQQQVQASINPHMDGEEVLLGMSFLKHLELVQRGNRLTLRQEPVGLRLNRSLSDSG